MINLFRRKNISKRENRDSYILLYMINLNICSERYPPCVWHMAARQYSERRRLNLDVKTGKPLSDYIFI